MKGYRVYATSQPDWYDLGGAVQFTLLVFLGLREYHHVLDIACGPLRAGRLLIPYLLPGRYCGIDPCRWAIDEAIKRELGQDIIDVKMPTFNYNDRFELDVFNRKFDFLLAQGILQYMGEPHLLKCFSEARKVMRSESIFLATFLEGEESYVNDEFTYPKVMRHTVGYLANLAEQEGLILHPINWPYRVYAWIALTLPGGARDFQNLFQDYSEFIRASGDPSRYE